jgi:signal transduction histidine kinase
VDRAHKPRSFLFRTLRGRLMLVAALATVPAFLFVVYVAANERGAAVERAEMEARYVANLASREHEHQVSGAGRLLERLAEQADVHGDITHLELLLPLILSGFPQIANLGVLSPTGRLEASAIPTTTTVAMADNAAFREAAQTKSAAVGTYQVGSIVGRPVLMVAYAVRDAKGTVRHILFAALELAWLSTLAQQASLPANNSLLIVDRNGVVLASSARASDRVAGEAIHADVFREMTRRARGLTAFDDGRGRTSLGVATRLQGASDVWVVVGLPEAGVYGMANAIFYRDVAVLAVLALLAAASSVFATDVSLLRDLRLLALATRRFGAGDLNARAPLPRAKGEIRDLVRSFNTMADALGAEHREALRVQEQLRALTHRLQHAREEEAARIAQELHDELGQALSVLKVELERVRRKLLSSKSADVTEATDLIDEIGAHIDAAVQSVRRISSELRPGVLDRLGLAAGLEWLLKEFQRRATIETRLLTHGVDERVAADISTALFRITQEALTNVLRYAHADRVNVELAQGATEMSLTISDNGRGFNSGAVRHSPSLGLLGMQERAARFGGTVEIHSAPGKGTQLVARIPMPALAHQRTAEKGESLVAHTHS